VEAAVNRDQVHDGEWCHSLGADYSLLVKVRAIGDYGVASHVSREDATDALSKADRILEAVRGSSPSFFVKNQEPS